MGVDEAASEMRQAELDDATVLWLEMETDVIVRWQNKAKIGSYFQSRLVKPRRCEFAVPKERVGITVRRGVALKWRLIYMGPPFGPLAAGDNAG